MNTKILESQTEFEAIDNERKYVNRFMKSFIEAPDAYFDERIIGNKHELEIIELINSGGFGSVYRLKGGNIPLAIKIVDLDMNTEYGYKIFDNLGGFEKACRYFELERDIMLICKECKNIMPLYGHYKYIDKQNGQLKFAYIMPELKPVYDYLKRDDEEDFRYINVIKQICMALQFCEDNRILHRDIKKENIFYYKDEDTGEYVFVLGDFGVARKGTGNEITNSVTQIGTRYTMAPEIMRGQHLEGRYNSDLYSLGKSLSYIRVDGGVVESKLNISKPLRKIVNKMTLENPEDRYQHASEVIEDLKKLEKTRIEVLKRIKRIDVYVDECKKELINSNIDEALRLAIKGHNEGNVACTRIYAYILCYKYCNDENKNNNNIIKARELLKELKYSDVTAKFLYAYISYIGKKAIEEDDDYIRKYATEYFKETADAGCPIAQYYYGKMLYKGTRYVKQNKTMAIEYLIESANGHFEPALYFSQEKMKEDPEIRKQFALAGINLVGIGKLSDNCVSRSFVTFL